MKWYWICKSNEDCEICFWCKEATLSKINAKFIIWWRNLQARNEDYHWFIREDGEHPDRDLKQYKCPECGNLMSSAELDSTWDWAGPHCDECGCTGLTMFAAVSKPVISGRSGM